MLNVGLIGYGYWGPSLARNLSEADGIRLSMIADARPERRQAAERRHPGVKTCADDASLIGSSDVDAVVIATPLATHKPLAADAINRGKHVLVEKPLAGSRKDAEALGDLAARRGVCLMVDHTFVYTRALRKVPSLRGQG